MKTKLKSAISRLIIAVLLGVLCISIIPLQSAKAIGVGSLSILPSPDESGARSWFIHVLAEGEETRDEMTVSNDKDESVTVLIFPTGYTVQNNEIVKDDLENALRQEPGHWVELDRNEVTIPAHRAARVGFTIHVPETADVGEHVGGIFIQEKAKDASTKGTGVSIRLHIGASMVINVPGDIERSLIVDNIRHSIDYSDKRALNFTFTLKNKGNVAIAPVLDTTIRGIFGAVGEQTGNQLKVISRNETADATSKWIKRAPYIGRFVAQFEFHLGEREQFNKDGTKTMLPDEIVYATYTFWLFPWAELIYLLIGIFLLYVLRSLWLYLIISRRLRTKSKLYKIVKNDTLMGIAAKFGVDPRVLAKFNMMRWPYEVHPGDQLLIPIGRMGRQEWREQSRIMLQDKEVLGGIFGHFFRRRSVRHIADRVREYIKPVDDHKFVTLIVDRGDTIQDVADFIGVSVDKIITINNLRPPYRLRAGQELLAPKEKPIERKSKSKRSDQKRTRRRKK